jgi:eukaryotic-like serine/threonine-protein kinase
MTADTVAGRYRLQERLSETAMAEVWLATDSVLERRVVVKLLAADADRPRFECEARAAAALAHPNVVQVFDYGEDAGRPYMVLEYLSGGTLADRLPENTPLADGDTRTIATDIAAALAHAHAHGVVHRDLKPGNVLFDPEDRAKVTDFGIAHVQGGDTLTDEGTIVGTAAFMAPEQVSGETTTPATDVYAFGVLLYRMLTGRYPFESENALELARMQRDVEPPPIGVVRADAPGDLAVLATAALSKDPALRPNGGAALVRSLQSRRGAQTLVTDAVTRRLPMLRRRRRRGRLAYLLAGMLLLAAGIVVAVIVVGSRSSSPASTSRARVTSTRHHQTRSTTIPTSTPSTSTTRPTTTHLTSTTTSTPIPQPPPPITTAQTTTSATTTTAPTTTGPGP